MTNKWRARLKPLVPPAARTPFRRAESYVGRLRRWLKLVGEVRGAEASDRRVLRRSLLAAPMTSARHLDQWQNPCADSDMEAGAKTEYPGARMRCTAAWKFGRRRHPDRQKVG